ncbi:MAG TPA: recombinase family protein [Streptosporangiaceae bacterium]|nr:recombinase family protein [Streptosporangiaceae bacterium]
MSTAGQARDGYGLPTQRADIRRYAKTNGHRVVKWCTDAGLSGALPPDERAGLTEALAMIRDGTADGLIVGQLDRLSRLLVEQEAILMLVWSLDRKAFSADTGEILQDDPDDPMRTAIRQMRGVFSQLDRALINKRLRDGRRIKRAATGHCEGRPEYGWRSNKGKRTPIPAEQKARQRMRELRDAGNSTRQIAAILAAEGHPTQRGGQWSSPVVSRILARMEPSK